MHSFPRAMGAASALGVCLLAAWAGSVSGESAPRVVASTDPVIGWSGYGSARSSANWPALTNGDAEAAAAVAGTGYQLGGRAGAMQKGGTEISTPNTALGRISAPGNAYSVAFNTRFGGVTSTRTPDGSTSTAVRVPWGGVLAGLPGDCATALHGGRTHYRVGGNWFRRRTFGGASVYVGVPSPEVDGLSGLGGPAADAQSLPAGTTPPGPDPFERLYAMSEFLAGCKEFAFEATDRLTTSPGTGDETEALSYREVSVRRPDGLHVRSSGDRSRREFWFDGIHVTVLNPDEGVYARLTVAGDIDAMLDFLSAHYGLDLPLADLIGGDVYASVVPAVRSGVFVGREEVLEATCDHLLFAGPGLELHLWLETDGPPLPRRLVLRSRAPGGERSYSATIRRWYLAPGLADRDFQFDPPSGAEELVLAPFAAGEAAAPAPEPQAAVPSVSKGAAPATPGE